MMNESLSERVARLVYSAMQYGAGYTKSSGERPPDWVARGGSDAQNSARRIAHSILDLFELEKLRDHNLLLEDLQTLQDDPNESEHGRQIAQRAEEIIRGMVILRGGGAADVVKVHAVCKDAGLAGGRVKFYCELRATAERLAREEEGCLIREIEMTKIGGAFYPPLSQVSVIPPTKEDILLQEKRDRALALLERVSTCLTGEERDFLYEYMELTEK